MLLGLRTAEALAVCGDELLAPAGPDLCEAAAAAAAVAGGARALLLTATL
jgi:hypothetical protein